MDLIILLQSCAFNKLGAKVPPWVQNSLCSSAAPCIFGQRVPFIDLSKNLKHDTHDLYGEYRLWKLSFKQIKKNLYFVDV